MLEERTFYFSEMQAGEVWAGLGDEGEPGSKDWDEQKEGRVKAILKREGVEAVRVLHVGIPGQPHSLVRTGCLVEVLISVVTEDELFQRFLDRPVPSVEEMLARAAEHADPGDDPDG